MIWAAAKEVVYSLFCFAFGLDIPGGYQRSEYIFGRDVDEWTSMGDVRINRFAGNERFADSEC